MKPFNFNDYIKNNPLLRESKRVNVSDMDKVAEYLRQKLGDEYADVFLLLSEAHPDEDEMEKIALSIPDTKANRLDRELQEIFAEQNGFAISKFTNNKRELNLDMEPFDEDGSLEKLEDIHMAIYAL